MSVSGISSNSFLSAQSVNVQNQQQWLQELQKFGQPLKTGSPASPQVSPQVPAQAEFSVTHPAAQTGGTAPAQSSNPAAQLLNAPHGTPRHAVQWRSPHHLRVGASRDNDRDSDTDGGTEGSNPLGQTLQSGDSAAAQQAYGAWQRDLQQVALNSDLLTAQNADWQPVSVSV